LALIALGTTGVMEKTAATAEKPKTKQQNRMVSCNKTVGDQALKGDERKEFMSSCLKG